MSIELPKGVSVPQDLSKCEESFPVKPVGKRMRCPLCKIGYMQLDISKGMLMTMPPQFPHKCDKCGHTATYHKQYPCIEFEPIGQEQEGTNNDAAEVHNET